MVLKGKLQIIILSELKDEKAVSRKAYELQEGERFLIPEGFKHQYFNLGKGMTEVLFTVAPGMQPDGRQPVADRDEQRSSKRGQLSGLSTDDSTADGQCFSPGAVIAGQSTSAETQRALRS